MSVGNQIAAIILAGGQSTRMGSDKGLVPFEGRPLVSHVLDAIHGSGINDILIITSNPAYKQFGIPCYPDLELQKGPLAGITAGLAHSTRQKNLLLGCDMPYVSKELISALIDHSGEEEVLLCRHKGKAEPLCSVYDINCITHFQHKLKQNELKITRALQGLRVRNVQFDDEPWFAGNEFSNLNSPADLVKSNH